jgi:translation initiation factor 3 subunit K
VPIRVLLPRQYRNVITDRYNPSNVGILEDYLYHQIRSREYDCLANLAILKLFVFSLFFSLSSRELILVGWHSLTSRYQFNPDLNNPDVVINILVKALASVPFPDFNLSVALLDERASNANMEEPDPLPSLLPHLTTLHSLLQQCRFPAFWSLYRSDALESLRDNYTVEVVGFEDSIREVAVRAVKATFQKIGSKRLGSYLDLEGDVAKSLRDSLLIYHSQGRSWKGTLRGLGGDSIRRRG